MEQKYANYQAANKNIKGKKDEGGVRDHLAKQQDDDASKKCITIRLLKNRKDKDDKNTHQ